MLFQSTFSVPVISPRKYISPSFLKKIKNKKNNNKKTPENPLQRCITPGLISGIYTDLS